MSDDSTEQTANPETGEAEETASGETASGAAADSEKIPNPSGRRQNLLSRPTDFVERPGFRNPANKRSKASKKKRSKK